MQAILITAMIDSRDSEERSNDHECIERSTSREFRVIGVAVQNKQRRSPRRGEPLLRIAVYCLRGHCVYPLGHDSAVTNAGTFEWTKGI